MSFFNKTVSQKLSKLSFAQIQKVFFELSSERETLFSIVDSVHTGIVVLDKEGKLVLANKAANFLQENFRKFFFLPASK